MKHLLTSAAVALALAATSAHATCVSSLPINTPDPAAGTTCPITASAATVDVVFAYKAAADYDLLLNGVTMLLGNNDPLGTEATIAGLTVGQTIDLVWKNVNTGVEYRAGVLSTDGEQHIAVRSTYADFQTDPPRTFLTQADLGAAYGVMVGIAPIGDWTFVGMEDLLVTMSSDFDYNDLIFGVLGIAPANEHTVGLASPGGLGTLLVAGLGMTVLGMISERRRREAATLRVRLLYSGLDS